MTPSLLSAFSLLDLSSPRQQASLLKWLEIAGYLQPSLLEKAMLYLHTASSFKEGTREFTLEEVKNNFQAILTATQNALGQINIIEFMDQFGEKHHFMPSDFVDLLIFLGQTAFDRKYGAERSDLRVQNWMNEAANQAAFVDILKTFNMIDDRVPSQKEYLGVGIMGAACPRMKTRLEYYKQIAPHFVSITLPLVLSGKRELTTDLDTEEEMLKLANILNQTLISKKLAGGQEKTCIGGESPVHESHLAGHLINDLGLQGQVGLADGKAAAEHWRTNSLENARDFAAHITSHLSTLNQKDLNNKTFYCLLVAVQPYLDRMCRQVQRAINEKVQDKNLPCLVIVEGTGNGLTQLVDQEIKIPINTMIQANSDIAAWMSELFNDAPEKGYRMTRPAHILMFSKRDETFAALKAKQEIGAFAALREEGKTFLSATAIEKKEEVQTNSPQPKQS